MIIVKHVMDLLINVLLVQIHYYYGKTNKYVLINVQMVTLNKKKDVINVVKIV